MKFEELKIKLGFEKIVKQDFKQQINLFKELKNYFAKITLIKVFKFTIKLIYYEYFIQIDYFVNLFPNSGDPILISFY